MIARKRRPRRKGCGNPGRQPRGLRLIADARKELDALCREVVFMRDRNRCQACELDRREPGRLQWCHVKSRRYLSTRWRLENSLVLCSGHHIWWHANPLDAVAWFNREFPERASLLKLTRAKGKLDLAGTRLYLQQQLERLNGGAGAAHRTWRAPTADKQSQDRDAGSRSASRCQ